MVQENVVQIFRRGVPTGPDVDKLMALNLKPGDRIGYGQVERIIGVGQKEPRFATVAAAWKKRLLREQSIVLKREGGMFLALTDPQVISGGFAYMNRSYRSMAREIRKLSTVDEAALSANDLAKNMLLRRHASAVFGHLGDARKAIAPPKAVRPT